MGRHLLITLHLLKEGLHGKHVVATWNNMGTIPAFALRPRKNQEKPVSGWPVAGPSGY